MIRMVILMVRMIYGSWLMVHGSRRMGPRGKTHEDDRPDHYDENPVVCIKVIILIILSLSRRGVV